MRSPFLLSTASSVRAKITRWYVNNPCEIPPIPHRVALVMSLL